MVVRGRWRPTRRNIVPIVGSLTTDRRSSRVVVVVVVLLRYAPRVDFPTRHLIYLLFLNTFVEQFVIARCRLGTCTMTAAAAAAEEGEEEVGSGSGRISSSSSSEETDREWMTRTPED